MHNHWRPAEVIASNLMTLCTAQDSRCPLCIDDETGGFRYTRYILHVQCPTAITQVSVRRGRLLLLQSNDPPRLILLILVRVAHVARHVISRRGLLLMRRDAHWRGQRMRVLRRRLSIARHACWALRIVKAVITITVLAVHLHRRHGGVV